METKIDVSQIKSLHLNIDWEMFEEADRALNWELWHGPLPSNYWHDSEDGDAVEPLEKYQWRGYVQASHDIIEMLKDLPQEMWYDPDSECVTTVDPENDDDNWDEDGNWVGGEWYSFNPRKELMYVETFKQVF